MNASINLGQVKDKNFDNMLCQMPKSRIPWYI